jgi:hypothetical protein
MTGMHGGSEAKLEQLGVGGMLGGEAGRPQRHLHGLARPGPTAEPDPPSATSSHWPSGGTTGAAAARASAARRDEVRARMR